MPYLKTRRRGRQVKSRDQAVRSGALIRFSQRMGAIFKALGDDLEEFYLGVIAGQHEAKRKSPSSDTVSPVLVGNLHIASIGSSLFS
jgi:hypothetical protein